MESSVDLVSVVARAASFITLLQAAGVGIFMMLFAAQLVESGEALRRLGLLSAVAAIVLVLAHYTLEAGRMGGEFSSVFDLSLQHLAMASNTGTATICRVLGLLLMVIACMRQRRVARKPALLGVLLASASFLLTGHTSIHERRAMLAPLLALHVLVVMFWVGALLPLCIVSKREDALVAARITAVFTKLATVLVPLIAIAGLIMAWLLLPDWNALRQPYGILLLIKIFGFAVLMGFAVLNKWRLGPALAAGGSAAGVAFRRSVTFEFAVACVVLSATAAMTEFFSPES